MTREERVVSGSDSFSRACATSYRFCTELVHLFRVFGFFESFVHHVTASQAKPMQSEPERELISSSRVFGFESFVHHVTASQAKPMQSEGKRLNNNNNNQLFSSLPLLPYLVLWKRIMTEIHRFINCKK